MPTLHPPTVGQVFNLPLWLASIKIFIGPLKRERQVENLPYGRGKQRWHRLTPR